MNKKQTKIVWIIVISIIALVVILPNLNLEKLKFAIYGTEGDIIYKTHSPGTCYVSLINSADPTDSVRYTVKVTVSAGPDGKTIYEKYDATQSTPSLPPSDGNYNVWGSNECGAGSGFNLKYSGDLDWNKLIRIGTVEGLVDYCPEGVIDPAGDGITNYKCNQYCKADAQVCVDSSVLAICSVDGKLINHITCELGCSDNACKTTEKVLSISTDQDAYSLGEDVHVNGSFKDSEGIGIQGYEVYAQLLRGDPLTPVYTQKATTDVNGAVDFTFIKPTSGETTVRLWIEAYEGSQYYSQPKIIKIIGNSIQYNVSTYSPIQYSANNITFLVQMTNSRGLAVVPEEIKDLKVIASMTSGTVYYSGWIYKGNGLYEASSSVNGSGKYTGKLSFTYEGLPQSSFPLAEIDVRPMSIDIDASQISAGAYINEEYTYTIQTFDTSGAIVNPDNLFITVSLPDGVTKRDIPFSSMTKVSDGTYTFTYTFDQLEKHTFDIYADYKNYARGSARASVAVSHPTDDFGPGIQGIGSKLTYVFYIGIAGLAIYLIIKYGKKKKK